MQVKANETRMKTKDGKHVIAFTVSPEDYRDFIGWLSNNPGEHMVSFEPYFGDATKGQKDFFHRYLRKLSEALLMSFEETKIWFVTEYAPPEKVNGQYVFIYVDSDSNPKERFKKGQYYYKAIEETDGQIKYLAYRGISMLNSQEMNLMLNYLKDECDAMGIKILSDKEYNNLRQVR